MLRYAQLLSHVCLSVTPWTVARQAPLSMGFSRQEYWSGLPFPSPSDQTCVSYIAGGFFELSNQRSPLKSQTGSNEWTSVHLGVCEMEFL